MAETDTETQADLADRVDSLEAGQSQIMAKLDELIGGVHKRASEHTEQHLDRPSTIAEQVNMELDRKEREAKAAAEKEAEKSEVQSLREQVKKMAEKPPAQPQPRRQRVMWGPQR